MDVKSIRRSAKGQITLLLASLVLVVLPHRLSFLLLLHVSCCQWSSLCTLASMVDVVKQEPVDLGFTLVVFFFWRLFRFLVLRVVVCVGFIILFFIVGFVSVV